MAFLAQPWVQRMLLEITIVLALGSAISWWVQ